MQFHTKAADGYTIVSLTGRLDGVSTPDFDRSFRELLADGLRVVVDLDGLDYISSAGLRSFLVIARLVQERGGRICLARLTPGVRTIFDISGLDRVLDMRDNVEEAAATVLKNSAS